MIYRDRLPCGGLSISDEGRLVALAGWIDALRDHGDVLFIHLRDRSGIVQVVFIPASAPQEICANAGTLRSEFCVLISGRVVKRMPGTENPNISTGHVEVVASDLTILSKSSPLPFLFLKNPWSRVQA